jgi:hypothetical protein
VLEDGDRLAMKMRVAPSLKASEQAHPPHFDGQPYNCMSWLAMS